ncbi:MarR family winged helix-turn-helix transcriptional regulator [Streptomyces hoynatensis]|uniref:MarR family transcriptional regulator n=1 Tax=Streptomyces hoynatensis TaxID=1141874 RepID=A0A3A9Z6I9_9ACTN|nr:MarR family transcriptional regulator [Streptomyces hoynatensis]RKN43883.1 MarR family transcriptional regulator [Streptomyces hoynatensis]
MEPDEVTSAVMAASRLVIAVSARALVEVDDSLTLPQLRTLVALEGLGPVKLATLAQVLGVNPSTALRMVGRLETAGMVDRRANPASRREVVLSLTPHGAEVVRQVLAHRKRGVEELVAELSPEVREGLVAGLRALIVVAGDPSIEVPGPAPLIEELRDDPGIDVVLGAW